MDIEAVSQHALFDDGDLATSACQLLRHYAQRRYQDPEMVAALRATGGDLASLVARGLVKQAAKSSDPYQVFLQAVPDLWWLDLEMGLASTEALATLLPSNTIERLRRDSFELIGRIDAGASPAHWMPTSDLFAALVCEEEDEEEAEGALERSRVLARGFGLTVAMSPDWVSSAINLLNQGVSTSLLRALSRDTVLLEQDRWLSALLLRGGGRCMSVATASLFFATDATITRMRDLLAMAPPTALVRVAEAHGLLTLVGTEGLEVSEALRTAFLTQVWQGNDLSGLSWWRAFRGEQLVSRSLPELGQHAEQLARDVSMGLVHQLDGDAPIADPARREALAACLSWVIREQRDYIAPFRIAEARIRELGRTVGHHHMAVALRWYATTVLCTARLMLRQRDGRPSARTLYARLLRLRKAYPDMLPRDLFPDTLESALNLAEPERAARTWLAREVQVDTPLVETTRRSPENPLPTADELMMTAECSLPLPGPTARWADAIGWSPTRLLGMLFPLPLRFLLTRTAAFFRCTPKARLLLSDDGSGAVVVRHRLFGATVRTTRRAIPGGWLFTYPNECAPVGRMVGWWTSVLLACATIGSWLVLSNTAELTGTQTLLGCCTLITGLACYLGAIALGRVIQSGTAIVIRDEDDQVRVWRVASETRFLLDRFHAPQATEQAPPFLPTLEPQTGPMTPLLA